MTHSTEIIKPGAVGKRMAAWQGDSGMQAEASSLGASPCLGGKPSSPPPLCHLCACGQSLSQEFLCGWITCFGTRLCHPCSAGGSGAPGLARMKLLVSSCPPAPSLLDNPFCAPAPTHGCRQVPPEELDQGNALKGSEMPGIIYERCILTRLLQ